MGPARSAAADGAGRADAVPSALRRAPRGLTHAAGAAPPRSNRSLWRRRRTPSTRSSTSTSRGRSASSRARADEARPPPAPVPRQVHPAARRGAARPLRRRPAGACSTRSRARGRRSCSRSRAATTRSASTSPRSTPARARQDRRSTSRSCSSASCATRCAREGEPGAAPSAYVRRWFAPQAADELLAFRSLVGDYEHADVLRVVLARAARSARLTTHFDLDFPREPQLGPVLVPQAPARVPPGRARAPLPASATRSTRSRRISEFARVRVARLRGRGAPRRRARSSSSPGRSTACSPRRPTRA